MAGGWVRDKLLGVQSSDVDIAIDKMTGHQFALLLQKWMSQHESEALKIATIKANPEKSKHLETATLKLFGIEIDFVNLRTEKYTQTNRIPKQ